MSDTTQTAPEAGQVSDSRYVGSWRRDGEAWISELRPRRSWLSLGLQAFLAVGMSWAFVDRVVVASRPHSRGGDILQAAVFGTLAAVWIVRLVVEALRRPIHARVDPQGVGLRTLRGRRRIAWDEISRVQYRRPGDESVQIALSTTPRSPAVSTVVADPVATAWLAAAQERGIDVG